MANRALALLHATHSSYRGANTSIYEVSPVEGRVEDPDYLGMSWSVRRARVVAVAPVTWEERVALNRLREDATVWVLEQEEALHAIYEGRGERHDLDALKLRAMLELLRAGRDDLDPRTVGDLTKVFALRDEVLRASS